MPSFYVSNYSKGSHSNKISGIFITFSCTYCVPIQNPFSPLFLTNPTPTISQGSHMPRWKHKTLPLQVVMDTHSSCQCDAGRSHQEITSPKTPGRNSHDQGGLPNTGRAWSPPTLVRSCVTPAYLPDLLLLEKNKCLFHPRAGVFGDSFPSDILSMGVEISNARSAETCFWDSKFAAPTLCHPVDGSTPYRMRSEGRRSCSCPLWSHTQAHGWSAPITHPEGELAFCFQTGTQQGGSPSSGNFFRSWKLSGSHQ